MYDKKELVLPVISYELLKFEETTYILYILFK